MPRRSITLSIAPKRQSTFPGGAAAWKVAVRRLGGFDRRVALVVRGLPAAVTTRWVLPDGRSPRRAHERGRTIVAPSGASFLRLTVRTPRNVRSGVFRPVISAYGHGVRASARVTLQVRPRGEAPHSGPPAPLQPGESGLFSISSDQPSGLSPGASAPLGLTLTNPNAFPLAVTSLRISIRERTSKAACSGSANYVAAPFSGGYPLLLPPGTAHLAELGPRSALPAVAMLDLPASQDACRGATVYLDYSGTATK
jgi:hypothetical protein